MADREVPAAGSGSKVLGLKERAVICAISGVSCRPIARLFGRIVCRAATRRRGVLLSVLLLAQASPVFGQVTREQRALNHDQVFSVLVPTFSDRLDNYSGAGTEFALAVEAALARDSAFSVVSWSTLATQLRAAARPGEDSTLMDYRIRRAPCLIGRQLAMRQDIDIVVCGIVKPADSVYRVDVAIIQVDAGTDIAVEPIHGATPARVAEVVLNTLNVLP